MPLIVHLTSLLLQILLFCPETDGAGTITWYEPPPVETTADNNLIRTNNTQLIEGSTNAKLHWKFNVAADLKTILSVELKLDNVEIVSITPSANPPVVAVLSAFKDRFNVSWINDEKVTLVIFNVTDADAGVFACEVKTSGGGIKIWTRNIQVDVVALPNFTNTSPNLLKVNESSDLQLVCEASGKPPPNITWTKDGSDIVLHTGATWNIANISSNNAGTYRCTADNGVAGSAVHHTIQVIVEFSPRIDLNGTHYVARGGNAYLHCQVKGHPLPTITWTPCDSQKKIKCDETFLNISKVQVSRAIYTCRASNYLGEASANTTLVIGGKDIYLTLSITGVQCTEENGQAVYDQSVSDELTAEVDTLYSGSNYIGTERLADSCGSLHVDLVLRFKTVVEEDWALDILRKAAKNGMLGELKVNASSIVGIPPVIKSTVTPPTTTPTPKSEDSNIALIVGLVVGGVVLVAIIVAVILLWRKKKCCNCCATDSKEVSNDEAAGPQKKGTSSGTGNNGYVDSGSAYAQPDLSSRPPTKTAGKKEKKPAKKGKDPQPAALPLYAQVDKTKKKPREPENTYDDANDQRRRQPGEVTYTTLDHSDQGASLPRGAANQTTRPPPYTETTYAVLV